MKRAAESSVFYVCQWSAHVSMFNILSNFLSPFTYSCITSVPPTVPSRTDCSLTGADLTCLSRSADGFSSVAEAVGVDHQLGAAAAAAAAPVSPVTAADQSREAAEGVRADLRAAAAS